MGVPPFPTATSTCKSTSLFRCVLRITAFVLFHLNDSYLRNKRVRPVKATDKIIKNVVGVLVLGKEERGTPASECWETYTWHVGYRQSEIQYSDTVFRQVCIGIQDSLYRRDGTPALCSLRQDNRLIELIGTTLI